MWNKKKALAKLVKTIKQAIIADPDIYGYEIEALDDVASAYCGNFSEDDGDDSLETIIRKVFDSLAEC